VSDLKATLAETLRAALVSVHPFNGEDYPSWFRDWIDQAAPEAAEAVLGLSGVAVTQLPEPSGEPDRRCDGCVGCPDPWNCK